MHAIIDQTYACPDGIPLEFDLFRPEGQDRAPLVVCIHGGGWISGAKSDMRPEAEWLAENGFAAACPNYRLAPLHPCPAAIDDIRAFVSFARTRAQQLGVRDDRIAAWGISAGGHLASMMGARVTEPNGSVFLPVQTVVDVCGLSDLTNPRERHHEISWSFLDQFMAVPYEGHEAEYQDASPVHRVGEGAPPFLIVHGEADDVVAVGQSDALHERLKALGSEVEYHRLPAEQHALSDEAWEFARARILSFLNEKLNR